MQYRPFLIHVYGFFCRLRILPSKRPTFLFPRLFSHFYLSMIRMEIFTRDNNKWNISLWPTCVRHINGRPKNRNLMTFFVSPVRFHRLTSVMRTPWRFSMFRSPPDRNTTSTESFFRSHNINNIRFSRNSQHMLFHSDM